MNLNKLIVALANAPNEPEAIYIGVIDMLELLRDKESRDYIGFPNFREDRPRTFNGFLCTKLQ